MIGFWGKGFAITKAFVCVQCNVPPYLPIDNTVLADDEYEALWFCAQCLSRILQGMGISPLELNTLDHALCALLIYCVWWNKLLDVLEPE